MFGIIRPCRHRLNDRLHADWMAHLCGLCLALRDEHGQFARTVTNYDGLVISALVEAQTASSPGERRTAGPCPLRGMRTASVARGSSAQLAAAVSLVLASAKVSDHVEDGDGALGRRPFSGAGRRVAARWAEQAEKTGSRIGFDTAVLTESVRQQASVENSLGLTDSVLSATEPTEKATAAAFEYTAIVAGREGNAEPLAEAGRLFGRLAHLLDAVEDRRADIDAGCWNPLTATGTDLGEARGLCDDAVLGVEYALRDVEFTDSTLVHALLVHELRQAVRRTFGHAHGSGQQPPGPYGPHPGGWPGQARYPHGSGPVRQPGQHGPPPGYQPHGANGPTPPQEPPRQPPKDSNSEYDGKGGCCWVPKIRVPPRKRNAFVGCAIATYMCCSCQFCCRDPYPGPWTGEIHHNSCDCDCDCCGCCDC